MRTSRRSALAATAAALGLAGCTGSSETDGTGELDDDQRPERPDELTRERVATYVREYERAYMVTEGIDRDLFENPDDAVSMDCRTRVADAAGASYVGVVQCDGTIEPDVGEPVEFDWSLASSPLYRVTETTTERIDPELAGHDASRDAAADTAISLAVANVGESERDVAVDVVPLGHEPYSTEQTLAAQSARGFERIAAAADALEVTVGVDGAEATQVEPAVDGSESVGVYVFVGPEGEATVTTLSGTD